MEIEAQGVEGEVVGEFTAAGQPVENLRCQVRVTSCASEDDLQRLMAYTGEIVEIQQMFRIETPVKLEKVEIVRG